MKNEKWKWNKRTNRGEYHSMEQKWKNIEADYRAEYPVLTDEDVDYRDGEIDNMYQRIALRTNRSREQVCRDIREWEYEWDNGEWYGTDGF